jgi:hypothetical protein
MPYILKVEPHPLGVVVSNEENDRELLIDGETCCCMGLKELKQIAATTRRVEIDDERAATCRLFMP